MDTQLQNTAASQQELAVTEMINTGVQKPQRQCDPTSGRGSSLLDQGQADRGPGHLREER